MAKLGEMIIELGLDSTDFGKGLQSAKREVKVWASTMRSEMRAAELSGNNLKKLEANFTGLTKQMEAQKKVVEQLKESYEGSFVDGKATASTERLAAQLKNAEAQLFTYQQQVKEAAGAMARAKVETTGLTGVLNSLSSGLVSVGGAAEKMGKKINKFGSRVTKLGGFLTKTVTVPIVGMGVAAVKAASDWEVAMAGVRKTNEDVIDSNGNLVYSVDEIEVGLKEMATFLPVASSELAGIAENAGQLGIEAQNVLEFTEVMGKLSETTNLTADSASMAFAQFMNVMGTSQSEVKNLANTLVDLGNNSAATEADIMNMAQRLSSYTAIAGITEADTLALAASLASVGINAEAGGTAMGQAIDSMNSAVIGGTDSLYLFAEVAGVSAEEFTSAWEDRPMDAIQQFIAGLGEMIKNGEDVNPILSDLGLSGIRTSMSLRSLAKAGDLLPKSMERATKAFAVNRDEIGALDEEYAVFAETFSSKVQLLQNKVAMIAQEFGGPLVDALSSAIDAAEPLLENIAEMATEFANMDEEGQRNILMWAGIAAAAGPALSIFGKITSGLGSTIEVVGKFTKGVGNLGKKIVKVFGDRAAKKAIAEVTSSLEGVGTAATTTGTTVGNAAGLAFNPWIVGAGAVIGTAALLGAAIYYDATEPMREHEDAVRATDGAYQTWFDSAVAGLGKLRNENELTTQELLDMQTKLLANNQDAQNLIDKQFNNWNPFGSVSVERMVDGRVYYGYAEHMTNALKKAGASGKEELKRLEEAYRNYGTSVTAIMSQVSEAHLSGQTINAEYANAVIMATNHVTDSVVAGLEEQRQAQLDAAATMKENLGDSYDYEAEVARINQYYDGISQAIRQHAENINSIMRTAEAEGRALREEEVVSVMLSLSKMTEAMGQSASESAEIQRVIGQNLEALTSKTALEFMKQAGIIDEATIQQIANAKTAQEEIEILTRVLDEYGAVEIQGKEITLDKEQAILSLEEAKEMLAQWDELTPEDKEAVVTVLGAELVQDFLDEVGVEWNDFQPKMQEFMANGQGATDAMYLTLEELGVWNEMTLEQKLMVIDNLFANQAISDSIHMLDEWQQLELVEKFLAVDTDAEEGRAEIQALLTEWGLIPEGDTKVFNTETNTESALSSLGSLMTYWLSTVLLAKPASLDAKDNTGQAVSSAKRSIDGVDQSNPINIEASDETGPEVSSADQAVNSPRQNRPVNLYADSSDVISEVNSAQSYINSLQGRTVYNYVHTVYSSSGRRYSRGTNYHPGGPSIVNDQTGNIFRELITLPSGEAFIPHGRNVLIDLPRGSRVLTASRTRNLFPGLPQYAEGVGTPIDSDIYQSLSRVNNMPMVTVSDKPNETNNQIVNVLREILNAISNQPEQSFAFNVDGRQFAIATRDYMAQELSNKTLTENLGVGRRG